MQSSDREAPSAASGNKMRRRSKSVRGSAKAGLRKTAKKKHRDSITQHRRTSRTFRRENEIERFTRELNSSVRLQRCSNSSAAHPPIPSRFLPASWPVPFGSAMPTTVLSVAGMATLCISSQRTIFRRRSSNCVSSRLTGRSRTLLAAVC